MIRHRENGYLVPYEVDAIYKGMKELITNTELLLTIREHLKNSEKEFDNLIIFDTVEEVMASLLKKH